MKKITLWTIYLASAVSAISAQTVTTGAVGYNRITCPTNADTIVGVPFQAQGSIACRLNAAPAVSGSKATLTLNLSTLTPGGLTGHYVRFVGGTRDGRWYDVLTASPDTNTASTVTINLNGDNLAGVLNGNSLVIARYWTLATLFPPAQATSSWAETPPGSGNFVPNGHAVVASGGTTASQRRTQLGLPNLTGTGIDRPGVDTFYITGGEWRKQGIAGNFGTTILFPDSHMSISHPSSVTRPTIFRSFGDVVHTPFTIPLATNVTGKRDSYIAIPRPIPLRLNQLNLLESGAFVQSANISASGRQDELLVYATPSSFLNKTPTSSYFAFGGNWRIQGDTNPQNTAIIPAGAAITVRKAPTLGGVTTHWLNTPTY
ncbi:MAG: TIGR02597 family protein [Verrucomicrobia bacterium]|nr:MAG: TIGR02597 family protein [Verrucomicrobiota bacterium]